MFRTPFPAPGTRWGTRLARIIATLAFSVAVTQAQAVQGDVTLAYGAPDHYVVVKGDTLWGIAGKFIKEPWRWPEIWHLNKGTIHNPNRIYPGDMVLLVRGADGRLQLKVAHPYKGNRSGTVKLEPKEYTEKEADEIPAIPPKDIEPYLTRPLVVDNKSMDDSGRIVAPQENRVNLGAGDKAYVTDVRSDGENWEIYRPGKALVDPDTKEVLGYEAFHLGTARLVRPGDPALMEITTAVQEISKFDRMLPAEKPPLLDYIPHKPDNFVEGRILSVYGGVSTGGRGSVVTLSKGAREGLEVGHVLAIYSDSKSFVQRNEQDKKETVYIPAERYGLVFVFRVFDKVSYGLVMEAEHPLAISDQVKTP